MCACEKERTLSQLKTNISSTLNLKIEKLPPIFTEKMFQIPWSCPSSQVSNIETRTGISIIISRHFQTATNKTFPKKQFYFLELHRTTTNKQINHQQLHQQINHSIVIDYIGTRTRIYLRASGQEETNQIYQDKYWKASIDAQINPDLKTQKKIATFFKWIHQQTPIINHLLTKRYSILNGNCSEKS